MVLVQNKYKNTLVGVLRTKITFVTHSSPSCYVTLRTQVIRLNSGNLGPQKTDSGVFTIIYIMVSKVNVGTKNVLLTSILYFQSHNKKKTTLVAVLIHQSTLGKELITFALCAQVISLFSGGLMTENRNSGGFLIVS